MNKFFLLITIACIHSLLIGQSIDYIFPDEGEQGDILVVTVSGENTNWTQSTNVLSFKQGSTTILYPTSQNVNSDTEIIGAFEFPDYQTTGYYDVSVYNYGDGMELLLENGFLLNAGNIPMIVSVDPFQDEQGETLDVTITGVYTTWTEGSNNLTFVQGSETITASSLTVNSDTEIVGTVTFSTSDSTGYYTVFVEDTDSGDELSLPGGFYLHEEGSSWIDWVEPNIGEQGETLEVTITGHATNWLDGTTQLKFEQASSTILPVTQSVNSDTEIVGTFEFNTSHELGFWTVWVYNTNMDLALYSGFLLVDNIPAGMMPVLPDEGHQAQAEQIFITTEGTHFEQDPPVVYFQKSSTLIYPVDQLVVNDTIVVVDFLFNPEQPEGFYDVHVNSGDDELLIEEGFELLEAIEYPELVSLTPESYLTEETFTMVVTGQATHFDHPQISNFVKLADASTSIIGGNIIAVDSETLEVEFELTNMHPPGLYDLYMENELDGSMMLFDSFTLIQNPDVAYVENIEPDSVYSNEEIWITVNGENTSFMSGTVIMKMVSNSREEIYPLELNIVNDTLIEGYFDFTQDYSGGYYDLHVFAEDSSWFLLKVNCLHLDPVVSIGNAGVDELGKLYPNPTDRILYFKRSGKIEGNVTIEIISLSGAIVKSVEMLPYQNFLEIRVEDLDSGIYLVRVGNQHGKSQSTEIIVY